uniref:NADH-ubiquinone oxidoreductase chain 6 n=1 Tax=Cantharidae sp. GENSP01 TaxID=1205542 RepID=A0A0S2MSE6_9COLE|nr:NADH deshydrogenase subunit 6 [Cantharidae sp. GENSP01]
MNLLIMNIMFMLTLVFSMMTHPLSMGLTLLMQVVMVAMLTGTLSANFWFSYILFMIMVGGMLVLFIYMTSIASNEKFSVSMTFYLMMGVTVISSLGMSLMENYPKWMLSMNTDMLMKMNTTMFEMSLSKYFMSTSMMMMMVLIVYLLVTLIAVVKITNVSYGPLRKMS